MGAVQVWITSAVGHMSWGNMAWSLVTCAVSCFGLWLSGRNVKHGWRYGIASQGVWLVAGIFTGRPGDIILCFVFAGMFLRNLRRWRHASGRPEPVASCACSCQCAGQPAADREEVRV